MVSNRIKTLIQGNPLEFAKGFKEYMSFYLDKFIIDKFVFVNDILTPIQDRRGQRYVSLDRHIFNKNTFLIKPGYKGPKSKIDTFLNNSLIYFLIVQHRLRNPSFKLDPANYHKLANCISTSLYDEEYLTGFQPTIIYVDNLSGMYVSDQKIYYQTTILRREGSKVAILYPNFKSYSYIVLNIPYQEDALDLLPEDIVKEIIQTIPEQKLINLYHSGHFNWLNRKIMAVSINWSYDAFLYALLYDPELAKLMAKINPARVKDVLSGKIPYQKFNMIIDGKKIYYDSDTMNNLASGII